jgi:probable F420-dependent oxidoreductase
MQLGTIYPQTHIEVDPGAVRAYGNAVEELGFSHILAFDHIVGANIASRPAWDKPYDLTSRFSDPFVLFSFLSAVTTKLGFVTGILILPQRQTALVAKQTASLDVLCGGRFRLGIGTGWNELEYEALGVPFEARGRMIEEQVAVLRGLLSQEAFTFSGDYHSIPDVGLCPMPLQRPVPIWFGGGSDRPAFGNQPAREKVLRRIARLADGWIPQFDSPTSERTLELLERFRNFCREYGRDPDAIGLEVRMHLRPGSEGNWASEVAGWSALGATHLTINTMSGDVHGVDKHIQVLESFRNAVPTAGGLAEAG